MEVRRVPILARSAAGTCSCRASVSVAAQVSSMRWSSWRFANVARTVASSSASHEARVRSARSRAGRRSATSRREIRGVLGGERIDLADDGRQPRVDVVDQRALLGLLANLPNRPVRLLGGAEDLGHRDGREGTPVGRLAARRRRHQRCRCAHGRLEQHEQQDGPHGRAQTTARRDRRHLHRGSSPGQGVQPASDPMTLTPLSEGGTASPSRFTQVTSNPCASAPSASKGEPAT